MHDLIIVGAGTAGCVLAEHLSRSGSVRVLLLEAGGKPSSPFVKIPAGFSKLFRSRLDWAYTSEPQQAAGGRVVAIPRGRMLGGSSNINGQIHQWCHPADFADWVAAGASGWGWDEVAPVFRAQETLLDPAIDGGRGRDGPMVISSNRNVRALSHAFVTAARGAGLGTQPHYNGGAYEGAWLCELTHRNGRRYSAYDAFLKPALGRRNLEVVSGAHATRVVFEGGRAAGVAVRRGGGEQVFPAAAVVLAAGAFGSPQLLMLSGIGPAATLAEFGIPLRCDAPEVGANLQEHALYPMLFRARGTDTFRRAESLPSLLRYLLFRRGMLASNAVEAFAFTRVAPDASAPDLELLFAPLEWRNQGMEPPQIHAFTIAPAVVAPRSRGSVRLGSADPLAPPAIDLGLLNDSGGVDRGVITAGVRVARRIAAVAPLAAESAGEITPGADIESEAGLREAINAGLQTVYHPTSTCRMGADAQAVVDPKLQVKGVDKLWVADASVMPTVPRGHPNAVVAMLAQRAASWIERSLRA
jgi:choline dehydrogenase